MTIWESGLDPEPEPVPGPDPESEGVAVEVPPACADAVDAAAAVDVDEEVAEMPSEAPVVLPPQAASSAQQSAIRQRDTAWSWRA